MSVRQLLLFCSESLETCLPDTADSVDIFIWKTKTSDVKLIYMNLSALNDTVLYHVWCRWSERRAQIIMALFFCTQPWKILETNLLFSLSPSSSRPGRPPKRCSGAGIQESPRLLHPGLPGLLSPSLLSHTGKRKRPRHEWFSRF